LKEDSDLILDTLPAEHESRMKAMEVGLGLCHTRMVI